MNFFKRHWRAKKIVEHYEYLLELTERLKSENQALRQQVLYEQQENLKTLVHRRDPKQA